MTGLLLGADYQPLIDGQGLVLGEVTPQNQALILQLHPGELKENPAVGCGISDMLLSDELLRWRQLIREQLELDGQRVQSVKITTRGIVIDAAY